MTSETKPPAPMEALLASKLPDGEGWQFEPKWDGFRCLAKRDGDTVTLTSKSGKPLARYFPEVVELLKTTSEQRFLIDGELIIPLGDVLSFDILSLGGREFADRPLAERRAALERFHATQAIGGLLLSPATHARATALGWLDRSGGALDGVIAKRLDLPYKFGERAMIKVKQQRTADCVVGGFRYAEKRKEVGSLLLGLFDEDGLLHHVGFTSALKAEDRPTLTERLETLVGPPGFTGNAPGGPSRWNTERTTKWEPLRHELVVEVRYDQVTAGRFRHGTGFLRWRPDKEPRQCTFDQLAPELRPSELKELFGQ